MIYALDTLERRPEDQGGESLQRKYSRLEAFGKMEMGEREKAKAKADRSRVCAKEERRGAVSERSRTAREANVCSTEV